jgi:subfamily B ATP-binding cassette protein HlyB/CyaB
VSVLAERWPAWLTVLGASLILNLCGLATPRITQITLDRVLPGGDLPLLAWLLGLLTLLAAVQFGLSLWRRLTLVRLSLDIDRRLLTELCGHLLALPIAFLKRHRPGDLLARFRDHGHVRHLLAGALSRVLIDAVMVLVFVGILFAYSLWLTLVVLAWAGLFAVFSLGLSPLLKRRQQRMLEDGARQEGHLVEALVGIDLVKALAIEGTLRQRWQDAQETAIASNYQAQKWRQVLESGSGAIHLLCAASLLGGGALLVIRGHLTAGELVAFSLYAANALTPLLSLLALSGEVQLARAALDRLEEVAQEQPEASSSSHPSQVIASVQGKVEVERVSFRYPGEHGPVVLREVTFDVQPGQCVAILGKNGSGKSTLARLLLGLYPPTSGQIRIDGRVLSQLDWPSYRRQVGVVLQENLLLAGTVLENIVLGDPFLDRERVIHASQLVGAHEFFAALPKGYETAVGEMGLSLSGGQRQWIALARALYRKPSLLLLDEPTSALDRASARALEKHLPHVLAGRTTILITHTLSLARQADRILVLQDGVLVEQGRHEELLARRGAYHALALGGEEV